MLEARQGGAVVHWELCGKLGYDRGEKYYNHEPQPVFESTNNKLLSDFKTPSDNKVEHNKPGIVVLDTVEHKCLIERKCLILLAHLTSE